MSKVLRIEAKSASAFFVEKDEIMRVIDLEGGQVADVIVYAREDISEKLDQSRTRINNWKYRISTGDVVYSNRNNAMFTIVDDRLGIHDLTFPGCSTFAYEKILKVGKRDGCIENLHQALNAEGFNLKEWEIPPPFSLFMDVEYDSKSNTPRINPAPSRAGEYVDMKAIMDCIVAVSSCADDVTECNHGRCKPLEVRVFG